MIKLGSIKLFFRVLTQDGHGKYTSAEGAYILHVPRNDNWMTFPKTIEIEITVDMPEPLSLIDLHM